jgi:hypothetical protein
MLVWEALGQPRVVNNTRGALLPIGGVFLGIGVVLAAVGIPLWLANHTQVDVSEHRAATASKRFELTPIVISSPSAVLITFNATGFSPTNVDLRWTPLFGPDGRVVKVESASSLFCVSYP